jgi:hypothetical protein
MAPSIAKKKDCHHTFCTQVNGLEKAQEYAFFAVGESVQKRHYFGTKNATLTPFFICVIAFV